MEWLIECAHNSRCIWWPFETAGPWLILSTISAIALTWDAYRSRHSG